MLPRVAPYLGIVAALLFAAVIALFSGDLSTPRSPVYVASTASSTLSVATNFTLPPLTLPNLVPTKSTTSITTTAVKPAATVAVAAKSKPTVVTKTPVAATATPQTFTTTAVLPPAPTVSLDVMAVMMRAALVNIICYTPPGSGLHSISGSGIVIDSKGIILTNAHIAQYFLFNDRGVSCVVRSGDPAKIKYEAALLYIPTPWIDANPTVILQSTPSGTGEHDFALLAITKSLTSDPLPTSFPHLPLAFTPADVGTPVVIATYGAQFLASSQVQTNLSPTVVFGSVKKIYTFAVNTIDVLALGGSAAAQEGSSGGGVADGSGNLVGTITTSTVQGDTSSRSLNSITASYIRADYQAQTGSTIDSLLAKPIATAISEFAPQMPALETILTAQLH